MKKDGARPYIPRENKSSADKRIKAMYERFDKYKPKCCFVVDGEGQFCRKQTVASHTIPKANVMTSLKGRDNKVLVTTWGVGPISHVFMSSSEEHPIDLSPKTLNSRPEGIDKASTGQFACCDHESGTFDPLNVAEPDFVDPEVLFLSEYRTYLYAHSLLLRGKWTLDEWNRDIMSGPNMRQRTECIKRMAWTKQLLPDIESIVSRLGKLWYEKERSATIAPQVVSGELLYFRSSLKFAACMFYGRSSAITVFSTEDDWHGMGVTHLIEDEAADDGSTVKLIEAAKVSRLGDGYSIGVLTALLDVAGGVVAMSPDSYDMLSEEEQLSIGEMIAAMVNADIFTDVLT